MIPLRASWITRDSALNDADPDNIVFDVVGKERKGGYIHEFLLESMTVPSGQTQITGGNPVVIFVCDDGKPFLVSFEDIEIDMKQYNALIKHLWQK